MNLSLVPLLHHPGIEMIFRQLEGGEDGKQCVYLIYFLSLDSLACNIYLHRKISFIFIAIDDFLAAFHFALSIMVCVISVYLISVCDGKRHVSD